ncbi:CHAT domain-containing protein [Mycena pura]|uniref:CHAT domain-containing protein n=1 Tax=Mycena pura TaxID=153505 RepID=A0AAD7E5R0_9AGAR|nr:CHAT domain-containing protein [Mycena pura]
MFSRLVQRAKALVLPNDPKEEVSSSLSLSPEDAEPVFELADEIFRECRAAVDLSGLRTAVFLLRNAALSWLPANPKLRTCLILLSGVLLREFSFSGKAENVRNAAICLLRVTLPHSVDDEALRGFLSTIGIAGLDIDQDPSTLKRQASDILAQFHQSINMPSLDTVIFLLREVLLSSPNHWKSLSDALLIRFHARLEFGDAEEAISLLRQIHSIRPNRTMCLCAGLLTRGFTAREKMLEISLLLQTAMNSDKEALECWRVGYTLLMSGDLSQFDIALSLLQRAEAQLSWGHDTRIVVINAFAAALLQRFKQGGDKEALNHAIELLHEALGLDLELAPPTSRAASLNNLAIAYRARMLQTGDMSYLDKVIDMHSEALSLRPAPHQEHSHSLINLGVAIRERYMQYGKITDLTRAIELGREALDLTPDLIPESIRSAALANLAMSLYDLFKHEGNSADLDSSIELHEKALVLRPGPHQERSASLDGLAASLLRRFETKGRVADLDRAIQLYREGLSLRSALHPDRATSLMNLASTLLARFDERGDDADLDSAVELYRACLDLWAGPHLNRSSALNNLATVLMRRFERKANLDDLDCACSLLKDALAQLAPLHPARSSLSAKLGYALCRRYGIAHEASDIEESIKYLREALDLQPSGHPLRSNSLHILANALAVRFQNNKAEFETISSLYRESVALCPAPHPDRGGPLVNLALFLIRRHGHFPDPHAAFQILREAAAYKGSSIYRRFQASRFWAAHADRMRHDSVLDAYTTAIELLPQIAFLGLDVSSRRKVLVSSSSYGIASDAAACSIRLNDFAKAVEFLEAGRSIFWQQALQLRTSLDDLKLAHPELGRTAADIRHMLQDAESLRLRELNAEWLKTLDDIRAGAGFNDFLRPKPFDTLKAGATRGPLVILNVNTEIESSGAALIVTASSDVQFVPLPDMNIVSAAFLAGLLRSLPRSTHLVKDLAGSKILVHDFLKTWRSEQRSDLQARLTGKILYENIEPNEAFGLILAELWTTVVKPVVRALKLEKSANPPRMWWCPTGPLAFLPIHAAGIYVGSEMDCLHEYAICSYSPTLTGLLDPPSQTLSPFKMTAVIEPYAPNKVPLPNTKAELNKISEKVPKEWLATVGRTERATTNLALSHLRTSSIVHFACHGIQDPENSLESGLELADGRVKVSEIMRETHSPSHSSKGLSLAFLSACETGKGDERAPDESVHLAATLLFAGFNGVVATMWWASQSSG